MQDSDSNSQMDRLDDFGLSVDSNAYQNLNRPSSTQKMEHMSPSSSRNLDDVDGTTS